MDIDWAKIIFTDESFFWLPAAMERYGVGRLVPQEEKDTNYRSTALVQWKEEEFTKPDTRYKP